MAVQIASVSCLMVVIVVMIWVLMVEAPRKVASPRTEQWRQRSWVGAPITPQTPPDPEPPMPPDPPPPPDQCGPWALLAEVERLRAEMSNLESRAADVMGENVALAAEVERLRLCIKSLAGAAHDYVPEESWAAFVAYAPEVFAGEDDRCSEHYNVGGRVMGTRRDWVKVLRNRASDVELMDLAAGVDEVCDEVERLRAEATGEASRAMMLEVDLDNARVEIERLRVELSAMIKLAIAGRPTGGGE